MQAVARRMGRLAPDSTVFLLCDVQERFRDAIYRFPAVVQTSKTLLAAAKILGVKVIATEQYPKALGNLVKELDTENVQVVAKTQFSMMVPEINQSVVGMKAAVLFGIESHVCVQQTALQLLEQGLDCHVVVDGVSSQRPVDRSSALRRMKQAGAFLTTSESVLFELMRDATHPRFREISALLKQANLDRPKDYLDSL
eukprot:TRINITY_DN15314_c0_g1_i1.p1 TRINITY_DN15314_c0_g1~~TRINITY_DN15314_c0_g1_i1.p1  ORF type:complete len:198 (-),score=30.46 TRINITY_DN15314_c0_g1_i1:114-707(-)